jgi:D,D-heptose 1,7-bisphosphate phosphatase
MHKALFLDRDGIINVDKGYVYKWEDIVWFEEIFDIIKLAVINNFKIIVLTNQSGIHYNKYTKDDVEKLHKEMNDFLLSKNIFVTEWIYSAEIDSEFRKPRPGMLLAAKEKHQIDLSHSYMIGDKFTDIFETDGLFLRPVTYLLKGQYDLSKVVENERLKIFGSHAAILSELKKDFSQKS